MPIFIAALLGGLVSACASLVGRVLVALSIGYVTYTGVDILLGWITDQFQDAVTGAPVAVTQVLGLLQVDTCFSILMSAIAARLVIKGLTSAAGGSFTRMVVK
jgi:hypothetical protein